MLVWGVAVLTGAVVLCCKNLLQPQSVGFIIGVSRTMSSKPTTQGPDGPFS